MTTCANKTTFTAADFGVTGTGDKVDALNAALIYLEQSATALEILNVMVCNEVKIKFIDISAQYRSMALNDPNLGDKYNTPLNVPEYHDSNLDPNTIYWDPFGAVFATTATSRDAVGFSVTGILSPALLLIHEGAHAYDLFHEGLKHWQEQSLKDNDRSDLTQQQRAELAPLLPYQNENEHYAVNKENEVAKQLAEKAPNRELGQSTVFGISVGVRETQRNNHIEVPSVVRLPRGGRHATSFCC